MAAALRRLLGSLAVYQQLLAGLERVGAGEPKQRPRWPITRDSWSSSRQELALRANSPLGP